MPLGRVIARRIVKLTRSRAPTPTGQGLGETLFFTFPAAGRGRSNTGFLHPEHFGLPFDGDEGWFEIEKVSAKPWPYWRVARRVEPPENLPSQG